MPIAPEQRMTSLRALMRVRGPEEVASSTPVHSRSEPEEGEEGEQSVRRVQRVLRAIVKFGRRRMEGGRYAVAAELPDEPVQQSAISAIPRHDVDEEAIWTHDFPWSR